MNFPDFGNDIEVTSHDNNKPDDQGDDGFVENNNWGGWQAESENTKKAYNFSNYNNFENNEDENIGGNQVSSNNFYNAYYEETVFFKYNNNINKL